MNLKVVLFLLCALCCLINGKATTTADYDYPCKSENRILFFYDNSLALDAHKYQKQTTFLVNYTFEKWTSFDKLQIMSYDSYEDLDKQHFKNKSEVQDFILKDVPVETDQELCYTLLLLYPYDDINVLYFLREFNQRDVQTYGEDCYESIQDLDSRRIFTFIILTDEVAIDDLKAYFPNTDIVTWADDKVTPDDWEEQFYNGYGCNPKIKTTRITLLSTTTENPDTFYPCNNQISIAYDKSNGLSEENFKKQKKFLVEYVFQNWTSFDHLNLYSYAKQSELFNLIKSKEMLESFILNGKQVDAEPDVNWMINKMKKNKINIIFNSIYKQFFLTFVIMNKNVSINALMYCYPQAQFIMWDIETENTPQNWERTFMDAYRCSQLKKQEQSIYPCNNRILIGFDESTETLNSLQSFLFTTVFTQSWNVFDDLALIAYSEDVRVQGFGSMNNLNDVQSFINNTPKTTTAKETTSLLSSSTQKPHQSASLCKVFYDLTRMYLLETNIVLFIGAFHEGIGDECPLQIKHVQNSANSITFVALTKQVNIDYLRSKFLQATFIPWNTETNAPEYWDNTVFGCENFYFDPSQKDYPCGRTLAIGYDRSHYLNQISYQRLTVFLTTKVFIEQWTLFNPKLSLFTFPNNSIINPDNLIETRFFIHQNLQTTEEPSICNVFKKGELSEKFVILFISKFDEEVLSQECIDTYSKATGLTFVLLGPLFNKTYLNDVFPTAEVIEWNIITNDEPKDWPAKLWRSFGCQDSSPIILPTTPSPSTTKPTTPLRTSTEIVKSTSVSNTPTKTSTSRLTTTTAPHSQSTTKKSDSGGSQERAILLAVFIPLIIIILIVVIVCFCFYRRKQRQQLVKNMASNNNYKENGTQHEKREEDPWTINEDRLHINYFEKLGSGAFGDVFIAKLIGDAPIKNIYSDSPHCQRFHDIDVAVKSLPQMQVDEYARSEFQKEIEFMKGLKFHVNLVCFLGYVSDPTNPLMILEYCANGDLLKFIKSNKQKFIESFESQESPKTLVSFAWQISSGLEYLGSLGLIHRDIAARNILLDKNNVCKVSDFGLCRTGGDGQLYLSSGGKLPVKWMAIESLKENIFSNKTDVWSYGVLLWELFTLGQIPYAHVDNVLKYLDDGKRLEKPDYCSDQIYEIMLDCWQIDPEERPTFTIICQLLTKMIETATMHYNYVDTLALIEEANIIEEIESVEV